MGLCFVTALITFCFYFLLFSFYVCLKSKMCKSFDRKKNKERIVDCGKTYFELSETLFGAAVQNTMRLFALVDVYHPSYIFLSK